MLHGHLQSLVRFIEISLYSGGAVLQRLLKLSQYTITVTVRQQEQADTLSALGVRAVLTDLDNTEVLEKLASESDSKRIYLP